MHDTNLLRNILKYFQKQEEKASRKLKKVNFSLSDFGSLKKEHFLEHFRQAVLGTSFEGIEIAVHSKPFGPELEITGLEFAEETEEN